MYILKILKSIHFYIYIYIQLKRKLSFLLVKSTSSDFCDFFEKNPENLQFFHETLIKSLRTRIDFSIFLGFFEILKIF